MKWWGWALALLPAGVGIAIALLAVNEFLINNPVVYMRGSLSVVALRLGILLTVIMLSSGLYIRKLKSRHERELEGVNKQMIDERRRFLQRLDHELKNPLTAIRTGLSNINQTEAQELENEVEAVKAQVLRISRLIADLRKLATLENLPVEEMDVNLGEILTEILAVVEAQPESERREITMSIPNAPWPLPQVKGDPDLLLLAIHNLLDNAVKFTSPGDTIEVRAFEDDNQVVIEVADTGPGIAEVELERVWEELYRSENAQGVAGSGLGLPLVRAIIRLHEGEVVLRSRAEQGTVFAIRIPAN